MYRLQPAEHCKLVYRLQPAEHCKLVYRLQPAEHCKFGVPASAGRALQIWCTGFSRPSTANLVYRLQPAEHCKLVYRLQPADHCKLVYRLQPAERYSGAVATFDGQLSFGRDPSGLVPLGEYGL